MSDPLIESVQPEEGPVAFRDLDPRVHRIFVGFAFSALGSGLTMPFLFVYLAEVRDFPTSTVGLVFAWMGVLGFVTAPIGGTLIDKVGPRPVMISGLLVEAAAAATLGHIETVTQGVVIASLIVVGTVGLYPATTAMFTRLVPPSNRERIYGLSFMLMNAGIGLGGAVSALIIDTDSVASFQRLYYLDGLSFLVFVAVLVSLPRGTGALPVPDEGPLDEQVDQPSWRVVLADRTLLRVAAISVLVITFGYAQMETGVAAYATQVADVPAKALGWAWTANTVAIVLGQLLTLKFIEGRRRSAMLALCATTWTVSWLVIASCNVVDGWLAIASVVLGLAVFGWGETLWAPVAPAIVNDLAREDARGRYNALQGMTWTVASIIGPASAGLLIGHGLTTVWVACVVGGTALAALLFLDLRRHLTPAQDGLAAATVAAA